MGHSTPELTAVVYSQIEVEDLRGAVEAIRPTRRHTRMTLHTSR
jgi:hypothetical protein